MYCFADYDDNAKNDLFIRGEDYVRLIDICFRFSDLFSLVTTRNQPHGIVGAPEPIFFHVHDDSKVGGWRQTVYYYPCSEQSKAFLLSAVDELFSWVDCGEKHRPEDLTFLSSRRIGVFLV